MFVDHASTFARLFHQISLQVGETLLNKHRLESEAATYGVKIKSYHADNHPFGAKEFLEDLKRCKQTITFSGVGAHHQNGVAERTQATITSWSLAMMMNLMIHWPQEYDRCLWPFAMDYVEWIWNHLPNALSHVTASTRGVRFKTTETSP